MLCKIYSGLFTYTWSPSIFETSLPAEAGVHPKECYTKESRGMVKGFHWHFRPLVFT